MRFTTHHVRTIETGASESGGSTVEEPKADAPDDTDWKARFEAERAHSREWEKRAKANSSAAAELEKLKASSMSELDRAKADAEAARKKLAEFESARERDGWKADAAKATGVPAELLWGDDAEGVLAHAKAIAEYAKAAGKPRAATVSNPDAAPKGGDNPNKQLLRQLFGSN